MDLTEYDYELPESLIAQHPAPSRTGSRLLEVDPAHHTLTDRAFMDFGSLLAPGDLLVFNDTRVIPARLFGRKATGGFVELMLERLLGCDAALVQTRSSKPIRPGQRIVVENSGRIELEVLEVRGEFRSVRRMDGGSFLEMLERYGHIPLPPYIERVDEPEDRERYQNVFAREPGAVAAPTAGLHFNETYLKTLRGRGVELTYLTLHVGAGTFQPIRSPEMKAHRLHRERYRLTVETTGTIEGTRAAGGRVVAVGTTVCRALESWFSVGCPQEYEGETDLFIMPGYSFQAVDALLTNFHLPRSSLLMLVCAFAGPELTMRAYQHAVESKYRFYSYGDAMFIRCRQESGRV